MEDIDLLLSYIETDMRDGRKPLIGSGAIVNRDHVLGLLARVRAALKTATGEAAVAEARAKAKDIVDGANRDRARLIDRDAAVAEARALAKRMLDGAEATRRNQELSLAENLFGLLTGIKDLLSDAERAIVPALAAARRSLDSALARIKEKLD